MAHRKNCNSFQRKGKKCKINNYPCDGVPCVDYTSRDEAARMVAELQRLENMGYKVLKNGRK